MDTDRHFRAQVLAIFGKEVREFLRDRRAVISMFVIPTVVMPLLLLIVGLVMAKVIRRAEAEVFPVAVVGAWHAPELFAILQADAHLGVSGADGDFRRLIQEGKVRAAVEIPAGFAGALASAEPAELVLHFNEGDLRSTMGVSELERCLRLYHDRVVGERLAAHGAEVELIHPFGIRRANAAPAQRAGNLLGGVVPYVIILLCFTGAMYPAIDVTAGEKERGTLEAVLCCPVPRAALVAGKFLAVLGAAMAGAFCTMVAMAGWVALGGAGFVAGASVSGAGAGLILSPASLIGVFVMIVPLAVLFSAVLLAVGVFARSTKEAQTYMSPLVFLIILPAMLGLLPGVEIGPGLALVPVLNVTLACKQILSGFWPWGTLVVIFGSTVVYAGVALAVAERLFRRESVVFRT